MEEHEGDKTWVVGPEWDDALLLRLGDALKALGYRVDKHEWGVGGSQELSTWNVHGDAGALRIEAETYIGLTVTGPSRLVDAVKQHFRAA